MFFIDGDHSYHGVYQDTINIYAKRPEDSFIVWHDFKNVYGFNSEVVCAVQDALGEAFSNVYVTDNNICGVYIPLKYRDTFPLHEFGYTEERQKLYTYDTVLSMTNFE